jgi:hypothetical protein
LQLARISHTTNPMVTRAFFGLILCLRSARSAILARSESRRSRLHGLRVEMGARHCAVRLALSARRFGSGGIEGAMCRGKDGLVRTAGRHREPDPTNADGDESADLEELAADGAAGGIGEVGRRQSQATGGIDQNRSSKRAAVGASLGRRSLEAQLSAKSKTGCTACKKNLCNLDHVTKIAGDATAKGTPIPPLLSAMNISYRCPFDRIQPLG